MTEKTDAEARKKVFDMIKDINIALMVTHDLEGDLRSRPMGAVKLTEFDGKVWFYTSIHSPKVREIQNDPNVLLSYSEPKDQQYVSLRGRAEIITDKQEIKDKWNEIARTWFPNGADEPDIALIKVDVESAEYWDSPSNAVVHIYGYAKALVTGKPQTDMGENRKVAFA